MVESEAKELSEEIMLGAVKFGHESMQEVIKLIVNLAEECANDPWEFEYNVNNELMNELKSEYETQIRDSYSIVDKMERQNSLSEIKSAVEEKYADIEDKNINEVMSYFKKIEKDVVRSQILNDKSRIDGRKLDEVRNISSEVSLVAQNTWIVFLLEVKHRQ